MPPTAICGAGTAAGYLPPVEYETIALTLRKTAPCQLRSIAKTMDDLGSPQIEGDILCGAAADPMIGIAQSGAEMLKRDIHDPASASTAAHFRIVLCSGLPIPD